MSICYVFLVSQTWCVNEWKNVFHLEFLCWAENPKASHLVHFVDKETSSDSEQIFSGSEITVWSYSILLGGFGDSMCPSSIL